MKQIKLVAWITFLDCIRKKALHGVYFFGIILVISNIIFSGSFFWELGKVATDTGLSIVAVSALLIILFLAIQVLRDDLENKSIYLVLSRPISRGQYLIGRYLGLAIILFVSCSILGMLSAFGMQIVFFLSHQSMPQNFSWSIYLLALGLLFLSYLILLAFALLWATISSQSFTAMLLTLMTYFIGHNIAEVKDIIRSTDSIFSKSNLLSAILDGTGWIFPNLQQFDLKTMAAYGFSPDPQYILLITMYGLSYIGILLTGAIFIFSKKEFT